MIQHHNWSLGDLDEMEPWEREIYIGLLVKHLKEEEERIAKENRRKGQNNGAEETTKRQ